MKKHLSILLCVVIFFCSFSSSIAFADQQVMTSDQFVACLQKALARKTTYINKYPYNLGYYDGTYISWDCWNLGKSIIWSKGTIVDNYTVGAYARVDTSCGLGDWTGLTIIQKAPNCNGDFSNLVPGEWLYMDGHTGYYIGNGQVIECTTGWGVNGVTQSQIDANGYRSRNGVGNGKWLYHGMVPWINYNTTSAPKPLENGDYRLKNNANGLYLVVNNGDISQGDNNVSTYQLMESANEQIWSLTQETIGYKISPRGSELCLNAYGEYAKSGDRIGLWQNTAPNHSTQRWNLEPADSGYVVRNAYNASSVLSVVDGNDVKLGTYTGAANQIWMIEKYAPIEEFYLDINLTVDSTAYNSGHDAVTYDVYINGGKAVNDVADYYERLPKGASYTVKDIQVQGCYTLQGNDSFSGTVNETTVVTIPILTQHTPEPIPAKTASCTEIGYAEGSKCTACGTILKEQQQTDSTGHQWNDGVITKEPTAKEEGKRTYTCTVCGNTRGEAIPPLLYLPGDINGDGTVNNKDLTRLMKFLAGEDVTVVEAALDVNGDKSVNNKDLTRLMKYLAGEDVDLN